MNVTEDWPPGLTVILAFADSFLSDMKLFRSSHTWCDAPGSATQAVLTAKSAVSVVSAIAVRWSASQKESSSSISPVVAIAALASLFCLSELGPFPLPFFFTCRASSARIRYPHSVLMCPCVPQWRSFSVSNCHHCPFRSRLCSRYFASSSASASPLVIVSYASTFAGAVRARFSSTCSLPN